MQSVHEQNLQLAEADARHAHDERDGQSVRIAELAAGIRDLRRQLERSG